MTVWVYKIDLEREKVNLSSWHHMNLTKYVQEVSLEDFGRPFLHQAIWNPRLRSTGGRFSKRWPSGFQSQNPRKIWLGNFSKDCPP